MQVLIDDRLVYGKPHLDGVSDRAASAAAGALAQWGDEEGARALEATYRTERMVPAKP
jgi:hypothetical protein